jgi:hypothetical protein
MPEYLAPGVYVEEVSFRAKSIEGVSTSVAGFVGPARFGPTEGEPELLTSFADFARIYGGIDRLKFENEAAEQENDLAYAVRAFFDNGGSKLYVARVFEPTDPNDPDSGYASAPLDSPATISLRARFPGSGGNMRVTLAGRASANLLAAPLTSGGSPTVRGIREHDVVFIKTATIAPSPPVVSTVADGLYDVVVSGGELAFDNASTTTPVRQSDLNAALHRIYLVTLTVGVLRPGRFEDEQVWDSLPPHPQARGALLDIFTRSPASRQRYLTVPVAIEPAAAVTSGAALAASLLGGSVMASLSLSLLTDDELAAASPPMARPLPAALERVATLSGGDDGNLPTANAYAGREAQRDPSGASIEATGMASFEDVEEISMVCAPGSSRKSPAMTGAENNRRMSAIVQNLLTHCQVRMRYRVAILDAPDDMTISEISGYRGQFDSTHAALYYPWITTLDTLDPDGRREVHVPPSGYVAGICARTDVLHGVFKAPANEVVLGAIGFEKLLNKAHQDVLNPRGVNCFRYFEGRGFRLWGARTISSDPDFKYFSVRRYFAYLEHSIDRGTQWAVFENNNEALWANVRRTIEDFLFNEWRNGALMGLKPEQGFFVRCDRSVMTQNDIDSGRLVCLIGVAVVKPAEYVIFRIGQFTADSRS